MRWAPRQTPALSGSLSLTLCPMGGGAFGGNHGGQLDTRL